MTSPIEVPIADIADISEVVSAAAQTEIQSDIDKVIALIPDVDKGAKSGVNGTAPNYDKWHPEIASQMRTELEALKTAIENAPTS